MRATIGLESALKQTRIDGGLDQDRFVYRMECLWGLVIAVAIAYASARMLLPITFVRELIPIQFLLVAFTLPVAVFYTYWRFDRRIASVSNAILVGSAFTLFAAPLTYVGTWLGSGTPLWDSRFLSMDVSLGLDWFAYLAFVNDRPGLGILLDYAYRSLLVQHVLLIALLGLSLAHERLHVFLFAFMVSLLLCVVGAALVPAIGIYNFLEIEPLIDHPNFPIATMNSHVADVIRMRGSDPLVMLDELEGIIVFPSFHMTLAILFVWGFWSVPVVRWVMLAWNGAMAAATPLSGGHYFVDLIAGVGVALVALAASKLVMRPRSHHRAASILTDTSRPSTVGSAVSSA